MVKPDFNLSIVTGYLTILTSYLYNLNDRN